MQWGYDNQGARQWVPRDLGVFFSMGVKLVMILAMHVSPSDHSPQFQARFIGNGQERLFACYHSPTGPSRSLGMVIAAPHGQESIQFHRSMRLLATLLAEAGVSVLRFDFRGCGDSAGDESDWSLDHWTQDLGLALEVLRTESGVENLGVIGVRLGGSVALRAAQAMGPLKALVAWDAVVDGAAYLESASAQHNHMLAHAHVLPDPDPSHLPREELLGFPMPTALRADLESILPESLNSPSVEHALIIESHPDPSQVGLGPFLEKRGAQVEVRQDPQPQLWEWTEDFARVHIPRKILNGIRDWTLDLAVALSSPS